jgi:SPASM domain peptide maturase of grasp-with-spasm system
LNPVHSKNILQVIGLAKAISIFQNSILMQMLINHFQKLFTKILNKMKHLNTYFKLFAHNIPVLGKSRSAIYDLQKGCIVFIPNILFQIIQDLSVNPLQDVRFQYAPNQPELFDNYINFLIKKDLGFKTKTPKSFPELDLNFDAPTDIYSAIIESDFREYDINPVMTSLDELLCRHIELRLNVNDLEKEELICFFQNINTKSFRSIIVLIEYRPELWYENWAKEIFEACQKIEKIVITNSVIKFNTDDYPKQIMFSTQSIEEVSLYKKRYIINLNYFSEAQRFNPFYNRKVCIDFMGNIKNDLRQTYSFGNISSDSIVQVNKKQEFRELWNASPDTIEEIKDSELRYCQFLPFLLTQNKENNWAIVSKENVPMAI